MIKRLRHKPKKLEILELLDTRMTLLRDDKQNYINQRKGYEGEIMFDSLTEKLQCECYILNDLLLKKNNTLFQIDTLIILQKIILLFEVKNFEGDFFYEKDKFYTKKQSEIKDPILQLKRCASLLRQLLQNLEFPISVEGSVVFINPEFTLFQAPLNAPIILPTQLPRYMRKLNMTPSKLNKMHEELADKLISLNIEESAYKELPPYSYQSLRTGFTCALCHSFFISIEGNKCVCGHCKHEEDIESAVLRHVREYRLLFPDKKVTTNDIFELCGVIGSKKRINRILKKNFKTVGVNQWTTYE
jgi:hypothetical protein